MNFKSVIIGFALSFSFMAKANENNFLNLSVDKIAPGSMVTILTDIHFSPKSEVARETSHEGFSYLDVGSNEKHVEFPEKITKSCMLQLRETYENAVTIPKNDIYIVHSIETTIETTDPAGQDWDDRYVRHLRANPFEQAAFEGFGTKITRIYFNNSNLFISCKVLSLSTNMKDYYVTGHINNEITIQEMLNYIGHNIIQIKEAHGIKIH